MTEYKPVLTSLGVIKGRDGIYLDKMNQEENILAFFGEINGDLCSKNDLNHKWYSYELYFKEIQAFECIELEISKLWVESSFDEVLNSNWLKNLDLYQEEYKHFILSTYDYVYNIIAKEFVLNITSGK